MIALISSLWLRWQLSRPAMAFDGERASSRQDPMARPSLRKYLNVPITGFLEWLIDRQEYLKANATAATFFI